VFWVVLWESPPVVWGADDTGETGKQGGTLPDQRIRKAGDAYSALVAAGVSPTEASRILRLADERAGMSDDPFPSWVLEGWSEATASDVERIRQQWYDSRVTPMWAKRLLDAGEGQRA